MQFDGTLTYVDMAQYYGAQNAVAVRDIRRKVDIAECLQAPCSRRAR
jgi:hypothetical protein